MTTKPVTPIDDMRNESLGEEAKRKGPMDPDHDLPDWLNVKKQLVFYASYHSNPINIAIHVICIPLILWSLLLILAHYPLSSVLPKAILSFLPEWLADGRVIHLAGFEWAAVQGNLAILWIGAYVAYYFALSPRGALTYLPTALISFFTATHMANSSAFPDAMRTAWIVHAISWIAQFIGHGAAEGRAPALLDNLLQAVVLAPFFAHLEVMFMLFNFNPKLQAAIKEGVAKDKVSRKGKGKKVE